MPKHRIGRANIRYVAEPGSQEKVSPVPEAVGAPSVLRPDDHRSRNAKKAEIGINSANQHGRCTCRRANRRGSGTGTKSRIIDPFMVAERANSFAADFIDPAPIVLAHAA